MGSPPTFRGIFARNSTKCLRKGHQHAYTFPITLKRTTSAVKYQSCVQKHCLVPTLPYMHMARVLDPRSQHVAFCIAFRYALPFRLSRSRVPITVAETCVPRMIVAATSVVSTRTESVGSTLYATHAGSAVSAPYQGAPSTRCPRQVLL